MTRHLPLVAAIIVVLGGGVVRARWASRQADTRDIQAAASRLASVSKNSGEWVSTEREFNVSEYASAGIQGALLRDYKHQGTGQQMTLMIVCGRPGPIAAHTPEVCYPGAGFQVLSDHIRVTLERGNARPPDLFWKLRLNKKDSVLPQYLNVTYSWSPDGTWLAPERDARFAFADAAVLYKLYAIRPVPPSIAMEGEAVEAETDPTVDFLQAVLPDLNRAIFPAPAASAPAS